jgi:hypothetical protein
VVGTVIGAIAGGGKGAGIGAAIGGGACAGSESITKGDQVKVPSETLLDFTLQQDVTIYKAVSLTRTEIRRGKESCSR